jgi:hypothetical protein
VGAVWRRFKHQTFTLTRNSNLLPPLPILLAFILVASILGALRVQPTSIAMIMILAYIGLIVVSHRLMTGFTASPFHRIDPQQKTILLLSLFAGVVLLFFSLSTNQEYYTFPAYLPILLLIAATITRAEQTFAFDAGVRRWVTVTHVAFTAIGGCVAVALAYGLWASRRLPFVPDIGDMLAHRGVGDYTLSTSHLFDLTTSSFAALRMPAVLAALAFLLGPTLAWMLRVQRRHLAATTAIALTAGVFLVAAHVALGRFGPMMSSETMAAKILDLERREQISARTQVLLYGDQAYGSSIPFYLGERVQLVNARSTSMLFGSTFRDAPKVFLSGEELVQGWGAGERKVMFVPLEKRDEVDGLLKGRPEIVLEEVSGKVLITDRGLDR